MIFFPPVTSYEGSIVRNKETYKEKISAATCGKKLVFSIILEKVC